MTLQSASWQNTPRSRRGRRRCPPPRPRPAPARRRSGCTSTRSWPTPWPPTSATPGRSRARPAWLRPRWRSTSPPAARGRRPTQPPRTTDPPRPHRAGGRRNTLVAPRDMTTAAQEPPHMELALIAVAGILGLIILAVVVVFVIGRRRDD